MTEDGGHSRSNDMSRSIDMSRTQSARSSCFASASSSVFGAASQPASLAWRKLGFSYGPKAILKDVTGVLEPAQITAIMGPSGSAKTTLLNVLSGRQKTSGRGLQGRLRMEGQVVFAGEEMQPKDFSEKVAYVFQDSGLAPSETPRDCLEFSAYLRLPDSVSSKQRTAYVDRMLENLSLKACEDSLIGSDLFKGISGGQQKRTAVGVELISNPRILFLDEPLSGLDSYNAAELVYMLKDLAVSGVPILMTLHQPASEVLSLLSDLIILHHGEVCFHGPTPQLARHFRQLDFEVLPNHNPADTILFLIQTEDEATVRSIKDRWHQSKLFEELLARVEGTGDLPSGAGNGAGTETEEETATDGEGSDGPCCSFAFLQAGDGPRKGCCAALLALLARDVRLLRRSCALYVNQVFVHKLGGSLVFGALFYQAARPGKESCLAASYNESMCITDFQTHFATVAIICYTLTLESKEFAIQLFHNERAMFLREKNGGYYRVVPYFLSKCLIEAALSLVQTSVMVLGMYWLMGLQANLAVVLLGAWLLALSSASAVWFLSVSSSSREKAANLSIIPVLLQFVFSGILMLVSDIPPWIRWMRFFCPLYYGLGFIAAEEFRYVFARAETCSKGQAGPPEGNCISVLMQRHVLDSMEVGLDKAWWPCLGMLLVLLAGFRLLAVVTLWRKSAYVL